MMENYLLRAKHENYALGSFNVNTLSLIHI